MENVKWIVATKAQRAMAIAAAGVLVVGVSACSANSASEGSSASPTQPAVSTTASDLPTEPEVPAGKVAVSFEVENCANCTVNAMPTGGKSVAIPLNDGKGATLLNQGQVAKTFFTIEGPQYRDALAASVLITQLVGKNPGDAVTNEQVKNSKKANICLSAPASQHLNIKAKVVPVSTGEGTMARFWADPTLSGAKGTVGPLDLHNGVAGVQNDQLC